VSALWRVYGDQNEPNNGRPVPRLQQISGVQGNAANPLIRLGIWGAQ
jgi:hypothetical protein